MQKSTAIGEGTTAKISDVNKKIIMSALKRMWAMASAKPMVVVENLPVCVKLSQAAPKLTSLLSDGKVEGEWVLFSVSLVLMDAKYELEKALLPQGCYLARVLGPCLNVQRQMQKAAELQKKSTQDHSCNNIIQQVVDGSQYVYERSKKKLLDESGKDSSILFMQNIYKQKGTTSCPIRPWSSM
eukprot:3057388-Amphidinium_carterae.1